MIDVATKRVVVLGLGASGCASALLLKRLGASVFVSDKNNTPRSNNFAVVLQQHSIDYELGKHTREKIEKAHHIVLSPGIALSSEPVVWARQKHIPIISEIELGYQHCPATIIATTGTNGKTTVTTLIGKVLEAAGKKVFVLGNIGEPLCAHVGEMKSTDFVSLEVSSFQLEAIQEFKPKASVILNITPDHLDRYKTVDEYFAAKQRIYCKQGADDFVVLNYQDGRLRSLAEGIRAKVVFFGDKVETDKRAGLNPNQLAVVAVAEIFGISFDTCLEVFKNFRGIEHRMEFVRALKGVDFINDSKATNVEAVIWALQNSAKPLVLIAGGRDKGSDFGVMRGWMRGKVKSLVVFGEAKDKIKHALCDVIPTIEAVDIISSVKTAYSLARDGDCVLLSPMCASFDMFLNYEDRGRQFKAAVNQLA